MGVFVLAASVDDESEARKMVAEAGIEFRMAYGVDEEIIAGLDAFSGLRQDKTYIQPTEFVLRPGGEIAASLYATTQLGRMKPREVLQFIKARMD